MAPQVVYKAEFQRQIDLFRHAWKTFIQTCMKSDQLSTVPNTNVGHSSQQ